MLEIREDVRLSWLAEVLQHRQTGCVGCGSGKSSIASAHTSVADMTEVGFVQVHCDDTNEYTNIPSQP